MTWDEEVKLADAARDALAAYQAALLEENDEDWRPLYNMRIDLANFFDMRKRRDED